MSRYRQIDTRIWTDEKFRKLSSDGKFFFIYLLTSPHSTAWGAYVVDDLYIQADLNLTPQRIKLLWKELANLKLTVRDEGSRLVCFPNWFKYNLPANEKSAMACIRGLMSLPKSPVLSMYCEQSEWVRTKLANLKLTITERLDDEQEQEQEQEQNKTMDDFDIIAETFEKFWTAYPSRNGKKIGKRESLSLFSHFKNGDRERVFVALDNYNNSERVKNGYPVDPVRFLRAEKWRDWLEPETVQTSWFDT